MPQLRCCLGLLLAYKLVSKLHTSVLATRHSYSIPVRMQLLIQAH